MSNENAYSVENRLRPIINKVISSRDFEELVIESENFIRDVPECEALSAEYTTTMKTELLCRASEWVVNRFSAGFQARKGQPNELLKLAKDQLSRIKYMENLKDRLGVGEHFVDWEVQKDMAERLELISTGQAGPIHMRIAVYLGTILGSIMKKLSGMSN